MKYIEVVGIMGTGKTSLARLFNEKAGFDIVIEREQDLDRLFFLKEYLSEPEKYAFEGTLNFLGFHVNRIRESLSKLPEDATVLVDTAILNQYAYAKGAVSDEELAYIQAGRKPHVDRPIDRGSLVRLAGDRNMILLCLMYFTQAYGFYFNITWLPTYLARRGLSHETIGVWAGVLAGLPLILSSIADLTGGLTTDRLTRAYGLRIGRCAVGFVSMVVAGVAMIAGATVESAVVAALLIAISGAADSFLLGSCWGVCQDVGGANAGLVAGCMNTAGQLGAFLSPIILPYFADPAVPLCIAGGLYLLGALCWLGIDPRRPIQVHEDKLALEI